MKESTDSAVKPTKGQGQSLAAVAAFMAYGMTYGRPHRASGELAYHVLDVMCGFAEASQRGRHIDIQSTCARPAPLPVGLPKGKLD